ncbi:hypothetical protein [Luteolibacter marinus]|uniref:hypothetical protein n=1 Tax=Luteolibacter marinus TaxID=2776705 RepID=UPI0018683370|nr:hypothetical protein [Luteolibacter marinus]
MPDLVVYGRVYSPTNGQQQLGPALPGKLLAVRRDVSSSGEITVAETAELTPVAHSHSGLYFFKFPRSASGADRGEGEAFLLPGDTLHFFLDMDGDNFPDPGEEAPETVSGQLVVEESTRQVVYLDLNRMIVDSDSDGLPDDWEKRHFISLSPIAADDPASDGVSNLLAMAMGLDPLATKTHLMPTLVPAGEGYFDFYFRRAAAWIPAMVAVESSPNLAGPWTSVGGSPVEIETSAGSTLYRLPVSFSPGLPTRFFRLDVTPLPPQ